MTLNELRFCWKSYFVSNRYLDFPNIRYKNLQYFNLVHTYKPKFELLFFWLLNRLEFFLASFLFFFPVLSLSVPFALHILSGCHKKLGVSYGQSLEMGPWTNIGTVGHFTPFSHQNLQCYFLICHVRMQSISRNDHYVVRAGYTSSTICLSRISGDIELMTSLVVQRARPHGKY